MIHYVRSGKRNASLGLVGRIESAERSAGLAPAADAEASGPAVTGPPAPAAPAEAAAPAVEDQAARIARMQKTLDELREDCQALTDSVNALLADGGLGALALKLAERRRKKEAG